jgi:hypothetical protein
MMTDFLNLKIGHKQIVCPKHGTHNQYISSDINGADDMGDYQTLGFKESYEGHWCMLCWLESLGPSLPLVVESND